VRVLRQAMGEAHVTRLEIRTIGQAFIGTTWVNRTIKRKVSDELFSAVEERLPKPAAVPQPEAADSTQ